MSSRVARSDDAGEADAQLREAISAVVSLVLDTLAVDADPHSVVLPDSLIASGRRALESEVSVGAMRRAGNVGLEVMQRFVMEESDLVACSDAERSEARNHAVHVMNVLLERLLSAVTAV
jgi:hypothetical protein